MQKFYKTTLAGGVGRHSDFQWSLPTKNKPREWMPRIETVLPCTSGYHFCRRKDLIQWLDTEIYEIEVRGQIARYYNKCICHQARLVRRCENWTAQTARLFVADCAERLLNIFEETFPEDTRARLTIDAARNLALGRRCRAAYSHNTLQKVRAYHYAAYAAASFENPALGFTRIGYPAAEQREQTKLLFQYLNRPVAESLELASEKLRAA